MITSETITQYFDDLTKEDLKDFHISGDYVGCWFNISNSGAVARIEYFDTFPDEESEESENILSTGGFIADKDYFLRMFKESESINPFVIELL